MPLRRALPYIAASLTIGVTQGLGQGFISTNLPQIAGDLGITTAQASWLMAAYMIPRASLTIMLIKLRTQYGLRRFAEIGIAVYVVVAFISLWITDLRSAVVIEFLSGIAAAPLSTLAFLYILEPLAQQWKLRLGLPIALMLLTSGPTLARVVSPWLIGDGGLAGIHLTTLGLSMVCLMLVYLLPIAPMPRSKVIQRADFLSFGLIAIGLGGLVTGFVMGPIHWWTALPWLGWLLAASVLCLTLAVILELHRDAPLIDIRWLLTPAMLHLAFTLFLFRLLLSEQSTGAPALFQALGLGSAQMTGLFTMILAGTAMGALACVGWMKPGREPAYHFVALALIAFGAWMDSASTLQTRPEQMYVSQTLIAFASMLFMAPAMMKGLIAALSKGPMYLLSFVIVFLVTQSVGGILGSGIFRSLINERQAFHLQVLREELTSADPMTAQSIAASMQQLAPQIADSAQLKAQAVSQLASTASSQAYVMAYNDGYFMIFLVALAALVALVLHIFRDWLAARLARPDAEQDAEQNTQPEPQPS
ncbi:MFS transporter [Salipiger sp. PrR002]|uniref:MFS transporter n=1 Tax=Salipiger sp. PrR002 TaxID=2706489 RepID=UPI0013BAECCC|nr:MFS transporter [Salipiger sp. PrR002]NDV99241.1 MFS transporter [Salipiger sp. PrR002]NDW55727.1 MFS transporter [Salipiger sp. PrR004]